MTETPNLYVGQINHAARVAIDEEGCICADFEQMDENQQFYLHKSIADLKVNQSAQNPITYLLRSDKY